MQTLQSHSVETSVEQFVDRNMGRIVVGLGWIVVQVEWWGILEKILDCQCSLFGWLVS